MEQSGSPDMPSFLNTSEIAVTAIFRPATDLPLPSAHLAAAPARPGHIAEREELDIALKTGRLDALRLFLDRHPDSRYRAEALDALNRLKSSKTR